jgi:HAD superfamily hydrolase (TIGR01509 family)
MKTFPIKAVILDMDGVLINTRDFIELFWLRWAGHYGIRISAQDMADKIHGCPTRETLDSIFAKLTAAQKEEITAEGIAMELQQAYQPMPGVLAFLGQLKTNRIKLALVTSAHPPKTKLVLEQLGLAHTFDAIVTADLVEKGKPHPACYQMAAARLNVPVDQCLVFEDAIPGATAAKAAGMKVVGINTPAHTEKLLQAGAETVIADFNGLSLNRSQEKSLLLKVGCSVPFELTLPILNSLLV